MKATIEVVPFTAEVWERFATDFSRVPTFNWCWCQYWRMRSKDFGAAKVPELRERLRAQAEGDPPPGLVAFEGDRVVGWVSVGPRVDFERIVRSRVIPVVDEQPVWSIVCFAIAPAARGRGVGHALLDAAVELARRRGAPAIEAYPVRIDERVNDESAFTGVLPMFERAGFAVVADRASDPSSSTQRVVVRRDL